jgi:hypothetical protein
LHDLLSYTLGCEVPADFVARLVSERHRWDDVFRRRLDEMACELRPDMIEWRIEVDREGYLHETRLDHPLLIAL